MVLGEMFTWSEQSGESLGGPPLYHLSLYPTASVLDTNHKPRLREFWEGKMAARPTSELKAQGKRTNWKRTASAGLQYLIV